MAWPPQAHVEKSNPYMSLFPPGTKPLRFFFVPAICTFHVNPPVIPFPRGGVVRTQRWVARIIGFGESQGLSFRDLSVWLVAQEVLLFMSFSFGWGVWGAMGTSRWSER